MSAHKCEGIVTPAGSYFSSKCGASAKVERNGKHYCGRHDPVAVKAKREAKHAAWDEKFRADRELEKLQQAKRDEMKRRAECFDELLAALRGMLDDDDHDEAKRKARSAIAAATGGAL